MQVFWARARFISELSLSTFHPLKPIWLSVESISHLPSLHLTLRGLEARSLEIIGFLSCHQECGLDVSTLQSHRHWGGSALGPFERERHFLRAVQT